MCGIVGYHSIVQNIDKCIFDEMIDIITYRGPDDRGVFCEDNLALGQRRLSIIEPNDDGHQPFIYDNRFIVVYNGEIYNYIELRDELTKVGYSFKTKTDTEVLAAMYDYYGEECVSFLNGMWAFCIYDIEKKQLFCSRDRFGIKPFYYWYDGSTYIFASEIKQILVAPIVKARINRDKVLDYLVCGEQDFSDETMFQNIMQLRGGFNLIYNLKNGHLDVKEYYSLINIKKNKIKYDKACKIFEEIFRDSVKIRLRADVPIGYCLSGGLDSSSIVCMADDIVKKENSIIKQHTISSCFEDKEYDEQEYIDEVVSKTQVKSHKIYSEGGELFNIMDNIIWHMDEPFGSTSIYAQWNVFEASKNYGMKVMLDGQGADEQLAGYTPFYGLNFTYYLQRLRFIQFNKEVLSYRRMRGQKTNGINKMILNALVGAFYPKTVAKMFNRKNRYKKIQSSPFSNEIVLQVLERKAKRYPSDNPDKYILDSIYGNMSALLHFEDRDSMAHSIESRVPFLDYRLVEFIFSLPFSYKIKNGVTKRILRDGLSDILPTKIKNRYSKLGFVTPEDKWINNDKEKISKELEKACDVLAPLLDKDEVLKWFDEKKGKIVKGDFTVWRIICVAHWVKIFQIEV